MLQQGGRRLVAKHMRCDVFSGQLDAWDDWSFALNRGSRSMSPVVYNALMGAELMTGDLNEKAARGGDDATRGPANDAAHAGMASTYIDESRRGRPSGRIDSVTREAGGLSATPSPPRA